MGKPVGRGAAVVISMMYKSVLLLLHTLPSWSRRQPRTRRLKRRVSRPCRIWKKKKILKKKKKKISTFLLFVCSLEGEDFNEAREHLTFLSSVVFSVALEAFNETKF